MTVVPIGGMDEMPALGCGPAVWCGVADPGEPGDDPPPFLVAVLAADTDDAGAAGPDDPLPVWTELEPAPVAPVGLDDPPHAASSSTSDPSPVAAAHPLLRITSLHFARMTRSQGSPFQARVPLGRGGNKTLPGRRRYRPGNAGTYCRR